MAAITKSDYEKLTDAISSKMDDNYPIMFLPVRLETKFGSRVVTEEVFIQPETIVIRDEVKGVLDRMVLGREKVDQIIGNLENPGGLDKTTRVDNELMPILDQLDTDLVGLNQLVKAELERIKMEERILSGRLEQLAAELKTDSRKLKVEASEFDKALIARNKLTADLILKSSGKILTPSDTATGTTELSNILQKASNDIDAVLTAGTLSTYEEYTAANNSVRKSLEKAYRDINDSVVVGTDEVSGARLKEQTLIDKVNQTNTAFEDIGDGIKGRELNFDFIIERILQKTPKINARLIEILKNIGPPGELEPPDKLRPVYIIRKPGGWTVTSDEVNELSVRVYPDEIAIKNQEQALTTEEQQLGNQYWKTIWHHPGNTDLEKGSWRPLVGTYGANRAAWIVKATAPDNLIDQPTNATLTDAMKSVIPNYLTDKSTIAQQYWTDIWYAGGNNITERQAFQSLSNEFPSTWLGVAVGDMLALYFMHLYKPVNFIEFSKFDFDSNLVEPLFPDETEIAKRSTELLTQDALVTEYISPVAPSVSTKSDSWSTSSMTDMMPDRFVFVAYDHEGRSVKWVGEPIDPTVITSIDPDQTKQSVIQDDATGEVTFGPDIKWMTDFEEAVAKGMGVRIPLVTDSQKQEGFKRLVVIGVKTGTSPSEGTQMIESLFEDHHYSPEGFEILSQGTPTNNTDETTTSYNGEDLGHEESFRIERSGPLYNSEVTDSRKKDGQWLAEALGISPAITQNIRNAEGTDIGDAMAMNQALFQGSLGNYLQVMLKDLFLTTDTSTINALRDYFVSYISGRSFVPALRVGRQPYGVLVTTSLKNWEVQPDKPLSVIEDRVAYYSRKLDEEWDAALDQVNYINKPTSNQKDAEIKFLNILGLNATSNAFYTRYGISDGPATKFRDLYARLSTATPENPNPPLPPGYWDKLEALFTKIDSSLSQQSLLFNTAFYSLTTILNLADISRGIVDTNPESFDFGIKDRNYMKMLADDQVSDYLLKLRSQLFEDDLDAALEKQPRALLYLYLHHALCMQYFDSSMDLLDSIKNTDVQITGMGLLSSVSLEPVFRIILKDPINVRALEYGSTIEVSGHQDPTLNTTYRIRNVNFVSGDASSSIDVVPATAFRRSTRSFKTISTTVNTVNYLTTSIQEPYFMELVAAPAGSVIASGKIFSKLGLAARKNLGFVGHTNLTNLTDSKESIGEIINHWKFMLKDQTGYVDLGKDDAISPAQYLVTHLNSTKYNNEKRYLKAVRSALETLKDRSTQELEMLFAEHVDLLSYRIDAWKQSVANKRLREIRKTNATGTYIGAYGWVENIKPKTNRTLVPSGSIPVGYSTADEIYYDDANQGYIHTPSINHANTAAVMRSAFKSNADSSVPDVMSVNLSSRRVKKALWFLEGIRNGQHLGALLGYQFERALHDNPVEMNEFILDLRKAYPLVTKEEDLAAGDSVETTEARNVIDGLKLLEASSSDPNYLSGHLPATAPFTDIQAAVDQIADAMDAISDLGLAEAIFHATQGNMEKASAVLASLNSGGRPPEMDIVNTPRRGYSLTLKLGVMFDVETVKATNEPITPKAKAEPYLNHWMRNSLGNLADIRAIVRYIDKSDVEQVKEVRIADLLVVADDPASTLILEPIDFVTLFNSDVKDDGKAITQLFRNYLLKTEAAELHTVDPQITIDFSERSGTWGIEIKSLFEIAPLVESIKNVVNSSRPMSNDEFYPASENPGINYQLVDLSDLEWRLKDTIEYTDPVTAEESGIKAIQTGLNNLKDLISFAGVNFTNARKFLYMAFLHGFEGAIPVTMSNNEPEDRIALQAQINTVLTQIDELLDKTQLILDVLNQSAPAITDKERYDLLIKLSKLLFGPSFKITPLFNVADPNEPAEAYRRKSDIMRNNTVSYAMEDWLLRLSHVRKNIHQVEQLGSQMENFDLSMEFTPLQFPVETRSERYISAGLNAGDPDIYDEYWLGIEYPNTHVVDIDKASMALHFLNSNPDFTKQQGGMILDEWREVIPEKEVVTGMAVHYDKPNAKAPQSILLAVSPVVSGKWQWTNILDTINETLDNAKKRAIEPDHLDQTSVAHLLPATMTWNNNDVRKITLDPARNLYNPEKDETLFPAIDYILDDGTTKSIIDFEVVTKLERDIKPIAFKDEGGGQV